MYTNQDETGKQASEPGFYEIKGFTKFIRRNTNNL
jgi:hypothetical protein